MCLDKKIFTPPPPQMHFTRFCRFFLQLQAGHGNPRCVGKYFLTLQPPPPFPFRMHFIHSSQTFFSNFRQCRTTMPDGLKVEVCLVLLENIFKNPPLNALHSTKLVKQNFSNFKFRNQIKRHQMLNAVKCSESVYKKKLEAPLWNKKIFQKTFGCPGLPRRIVFHAVERRKKSVLLKSTRTSRCTQKNGSGIHGRFSSHYGRLRVPNGVNDMQNL